MEMLVQQYQGKGRTAFVIRETGRGGWFYRICMAWILRGGSKARFR
jgi:hypothetical protein